MKTRTIEELHDKEIGHRKFAKVCDILTERGFIISNIREYNEQFKFNCDGCPFTFRKEWKASANDFVEYFIQVFNDQKRLIEYMEEK